MCKIFSKLKSHTGSTVIIALLFTMICAFVGGAVLTAATVNGGRLNGRRAQQQAILHQRSLASVLVNELETNPGEVDFSVPLMQNVAGKTEAVIPGGEGALKTAIFQAAARVYNQKKTEAEETFTVTYPDGSEEICTVKCDSSYDVRISFGSPDAQPGAARSEAQVELLIHGRLASGSIRWDGCEIVKAVTEE